MSENEQHSPSNTDLSSWFLVAEGGWLAGQRFEIKQHTVLGRDANCDITIPGTHLSRRHAELAVKDGKLLIRDLNSANGTFVNEEAIAETSLKPSDTVRFDVLNFRVEGPGSKAMGTNRETGQTGKASNPAPNKASTKLRHQASKASPAGNLNNSANNSMQTSAPANHGAWLFNVFAVLMTLICLAGLGYLITQL